jgi:hypothetical protein
LGQEKQFLHSFQTGRYTSFSEARQSRLAESALSMM